MFLLFWVEMLPGSPPGNPAIYPSGGYPEGILVYPGAVKGLVGVCFGLGLLHVFTSLELPRIVAESTDNDTDVTRIHSESSLARCWIDHGLILKRFWDFPGSTPGRSWADPGVLLGRPWIHPGSIPGEFCDDSGSTLH